MRKVQRWRLAIKQVANLRGWHVPSDPKPQIIDDIVREVKKKFRKLKYVDADLVGMQSKVREVEELLDLGSNDEIRVLGICGMGGIGKSTLARVVYDKISHHFDASHLVLDAPEFHETTWIRHHKRTLLILDCVYTLYIRLSLGLAVREKQLGGGSRIIITTRDEGILKIFGKYHIYRVKLLSKKEALQLFCRKAFKCDFPVRGCYDEDLINRALQYADGLPLAIVKLGSFLYNTRSSEWSKALVEFKKVASFMIMKILKRSFNELNIFCQNMFLDIACFFVGKDIYYVQGILDGQTYAYERTYFHRLGILDGQTYAYEGTYSHRFREVLRLSTEIILEGQLHVKKDIQPLIEKSVVTIKDQKIQMYSLLQEMGRKIVQQEFPSDPEKWSRLWDLNDIYRVMQNGSITLHKVEAIVLDLEDYHGSTLRVDAISNMSNLRLLIFRNVKCFGVLNRLSSNLQYISWHQYPFASLPSSYYPHYLEQLIMLESCVTTITTWDEEKESPRLGEAAHEDVAHCLYPHEFPCLRNMNLSGSKDLRKMSDFKRFPRLERLDLEGCVKLSHLHPSIAHVSQLKFLNLRHCTGLISIPNHLFSLSSLEFLNLAGCSKFANCPNFSKDPFSSNLFLVGDGNDYAYKNI